MTRGRIVRVAGTVLLYAVLGLASSVAVAWGATIEYIATEPMNLIDQYKLRRTPAILVHSQRRDTAALDSSGLPQWTRYRRYEPPSWSRLHAPPREGEGGLFELAAGWPRVCLSYSAGFEGKKPSYISNRSADAIDGRLALNEFRGHWRDVIRLPARPLLVNLLIDMLAWGLIWLALFNVHRLWRLNNWLKRTRRTRCVWCGYDLTRLEGDRCPECGHVLRKRPRLFEFHTAMPAAFVLLLLVLVEAALIITFTAGRIGEPIHRAAYRGDLQMLRAELDSGAPVDVLARERQFAGLTPLALAAAQGHLELVAELLDRGADVDASGNNRFRPIDHAIVNNHIAVVEQLLDGGASVQNPQLIRYLPIQNAVMRGNSEVVRLLMDRDVDLSSVEQSNGTSLLAAAVIGRDRELVLDLLEAGYDPNRGNPDSGRALMYAVTRDEELVQALLDAGAVPVYADLWAAIRSGSLDTLKLLIEHGGDVNATNPVAGSLLSVAGQRRYWGRDDYREVWTYLVEQGADVNARFKGRTILMEFVDRGDGVFMEFLLASGADQTLTDAEGKTARDRAEADDRLEFYDEMIRMWEASDEGAEPEIDPDGA